MFPFSFTAIKLAFIGTFFLAFAGSVAYVTHRFDAAKYEGLELQYAQAQAKAVAEAQAEQKRLDAISTAAAQRGGTSGRAHRYREAPTLRG
jgi:hypothetical protein